jgi:hypothetical protein
MIFNQYNFKNFKIFLHETNNYLTFKVYDAIENDGVCACLWDVWCNTYNNLNNSPYQNFVVNSNDFLYLSDNYTINNRGFYTGQLIKKIQKIIQTQVYVKF